MHSRMTRVTRHAAPACTSISLINYIPPLPRCKLHLSLCFNYLRANVSFNIHGARNTMRSAPPVKIRFRNSDVNFTPRSTTFVSFPVKNRSRNMKVSLGSLCCCITKLSTISFHNPFAFYLQFTHVSLQPRIKSIRIFALS